MGEGETIVFRLYVAGEGPNSVQARANLAALCKQHLAGRCEVEVEVVNVLREPQRALADGVLLTPMLLKLGPAPTRRIAGNLRDLPGLLAALGLPEQGV